MNLLVIGNIFLLGFLESLHSLDAECRMTMPEVIKYWKYPVEIHKVETSDGYILELHRIPVGRDTRPAPFSKTRPVVFMQHGLFGDSFDFAANLPSQSPAFVFADAGFDVWMGNSRGSLASSKHVKMDNTQKQFWNFSWYEMSHYDIPASIEYVLQKTDQKKLFYIGHSQGTVIMFARLSEDPAFGEKLHAFFSLAPVGGVAHIKGMFALLGRYFYKFVEAFLDMMAERPLGIPKKIQEKIGQFCDNGWIEPVCKTTIKMFDGSETQINDTRTGVFLCHFPAPTSAKDVLHWAQLVKHKNFARFDYGSAGNMKEYGQSSPPEFDVSRINTPTYLYWSEDDVLADAEDIRNFILNRMNKTIAKSVNLFHFSHLDFIYGLRATEELYRPIIREIYSVLRKNHILEKIRRND